MVLPLVHHMWQPVRAQVHIIVNLQNQPLAAFLRSFAAVKDEILPSDLEPMDKSIAPLLQK